MTTGMTPTRVLELIAAHGADPAGWPEAEREAAVVVLAENPELYSETLAEARLLDEALSNLPEPALPAGLAARILTNAPRSVVKAGSYNRRNVLRGLFGTRDKLWPLRAGLASLFTGIAVGYGAMAMTIDARFDADEIFYMAIDGGYDIGFEEAQP